jgi:hypothetical protein
MLQFKRHGNISLEYLWLVFRKSLCDRERERDDYASSCTLLVLIQLEVSVWTQKPLDTCQCNAHLLITNLFVPHKALFKLFPEVQQTRGKVFYFYNFFYMFQALPPPIIRSTKLYIYRRVLSNHCG